MKNNYVYADTPQNRKLNRVGIKYGTRLKVDELPDYKMWLFFHDTGDEESWGQYRERAKNIPKNNKDIDINQLFSSISNKTGNKIIMENTDKEKKDFTPIMKKLNSIVENFNCLYKGKNINNKEKLSLLEENKYGDIILMYLLLKYKNTCYGGDLQYYHEKKKMIFSDEEFVKCLNIEKVRYIFIELSISGKINHANFLIVDKQNKTIERFEPNGQTNWGFESDFNSQLKKIFIKKKYNIIEYIPPESFCPKYGIQARENIENYDTDIHKGSCYAWSFWYVNVRMEYPDMDKSTIVDYFHKLYAPYEYSIYSLQNTYKDELLRLYKNTKSKKNQELLKNKYIELMNKKSDFFNLRKYIVNYASCFMKMKQEIDDLIIYAVKNDFVSREYVSKTKVVPFMYYNKIIEKITSYNYKENI